MKAVLLDFDGTLADTPVAFVRAAEAAVARLWPTLPAAEAKHLARYFTADPGGHFRAYMRGDTDFLTMRQRRLCDMAGFGGVKVPAEGFAIFEDVFWPTMLQCLEVFDDTVPLLTYLAAQGIPFGLLTNATAAKTWDKLVRTELAAHFDIVIAADQLGVGKPDQRIFHYGCQQLGLPPSEVTYVGDEVAADAIGARDAGLQSIWLDRLGQQAALPAPLPGVRVITSLVELIGPGHLGQPGQ